ncbi:MAG TPA: tyrosine-type recombinase/integrase [Candidatus Binataceae bacterium]|nr:tyrosine-type recombinase/integrase [Candidatus Binataceae bacterium]
MRGLGSWYRRLGSRFWWIQYSKRGRRVREAVGSEKEKDARDLLCDRLGDARARIPARLTVGDLYLGLERDYVISRKKSVRNVRSSWEHHLKPVFADTPAGELEPDRLSAYVAGRQAEGARNATINRELAALKRMYKLGQQSGKLREAPYMPHLAERNVRKGFVRDGDYEALARETGAVGLWLRAMFELGYTYGWRKTELLGMRVGQVDMIERTLRLEAGETKNEEPRLVEMTGKVYELIKACCAGKSAKDAVFTRRARNGHKRVSTIVDMRDAWATATAAAGCAGLLFHDLRRTAIRNMRRHGISEKVAMTISGHKTRSVFERYNIVDRADVHEAIGKIERATRERKQHELFEQAEMFHAEQPAELTLIDRAAPPKKAVGREVGAPPANLAKGVQ